VGGAIVAFDIPGQGPYTIRPASSLPPLLGNITLDGTTEPDFVGTPVVELDGTDAGGFAQGLSVSGSGNTIRGLTVNRFSDNGISIGAGGQGNLVEGCFVGTDVTGMLDLGNGNAGIMIGQASDNTIGGTTSAARNVVSGNAEGITIVDATSTGNVLLGNYIGTDVTGTVAVPNGTGVLLLAPDNTVGGTTAGSGNLISGNTGLGISLGPPNATGNLIAGNHIGVDATGTLALGNDVGVWVDNVADNTIGGTATSARNVISGNREGITLWGTGATGTLIHGNYIGTDASGLEAIPNETGIPVYGPGNTIGGTEVGAGNLISGNEGAGVSFFGADASGNTVQGNLIGTDATGSSGLGNGEHGVALVESADNTVGGSTAGAGNVLSANEVAGIFLLGEATAGNVIQGNFIGTDFSGSSAIGNGESGIAIHAARNNTIGGTDSGARNILSGNSFGILIATNDANGNSIQGNYIGTDATGSSAIPNSQSGILLWSEGTVIGGAVAGAGNVISGNGFAGIDMGGGSSGTTIQGNYIGTDATGAVALNNDIGIFVNFSSDNIIGGTESGAGNVISGNIGDGLAVNGLGATGNVIQGNFIGTDVTGTAAVGNGAGLSVADAPGNTFGGTESGAGNVISGNAGNSLTVSGLDATGNTIQGNYIGTDGTGTAALGNGGGFWIIDGSDNTIGGTQDGAGNVISNNGGGIRIDGPGASGNTVQGNKIGTDITGTAPMGNGGATVRLSNGASNNTIGGTETGAGNIITGGGWMGVILFADAGTGNRILSNSIFDNGALGIELGRDGVSLNDDSDADTGPNGLQNYPTLTSVVSDGGAVIQATLNSAPSSSFDLEFFSNTECDPAGFGEGKTPLGRATLATDASGSGTVTASFSSITGTILTATATDADGNTSEFSECGDLTTLGISPSPETRTVSQGQSASYTINLSAQGGTFEEAVALSCSGAPSGAACAFMDDEVTLAAGQATTTMTVTTTAPATSILVAPRRLPWNPPGWPWALLLLFPGVVVLLPGIGGKGWKAKGSGPGRRLVTRLGWGTLAASTAVILILQASCGDGGTSPPTGGTPTGTYEITVTATWESVQTTATATLVVQ
jgi:hypothetical protein